jgi:hypothetical protein
MIVIDRSPGIFIPKEDEDELKSEPINFQGLFLIKDPRKYVKPLVIPKESTISSTITLPKEYNPECDRSEDERNALLYNFGLALKAVYEKWQDIRKANKVKIPQPNANQPPKEGWFRSALSWVTRSGRYAGKELDTKDRISWIDIMNHPYNQETHEIYDSPDLEIIQSIDNWQSPELREIVEIYRKAIDRNSMALPAEIAKKVPLPVYKFTMQQVTDSVDNFLAKHTYTYVAADNCWRWRDIFSPAKQEATCSLKDQEKWEKEIREYLENEWVKKFENKDDQVLSVTNLQFIYETIINHVAKKREDLIKDKSQEHLSNYNYVFLSKLRNITEELLSDLVNRESPLNYPWYNTVQGRFQLQLLETAFKYRNTSNKSFKKHFEVFSDYIFGTCH